MCLVNSSFHCDIIDVFSPRASRPRAASLARYANLMELCQTCRTKTRARAADSGLSSGPSRAFAPLLSRQLRYSLHNVSDPL